MIRKVKKNIFFWLVNNMPAARKGEKITDPVVLERLAKAREKALETRRANAKMKADAKLADQLEKKKADAEVQKRIKKTIDPAPETPKEEVPKPPPKEAAPEPVSQVREEVEIEYIKAPKKKPKKKKVVIVQSSSESEEEEIVYKSRKGSKRVKNDTPQQERPAESPIERDPMDVLFSRLYGK